MNVKFETRGGSAVRVEKGKTWVKLWGRWTHLGWLDEEDGRFRARAPRGSSLGSHPTAEAAVEAMLRQFAG